MSGPYYAQRFPADDRWTSVWKRTKGYPDQLIATGMDTATAARVARLLNADEERT